MRVRTHVYALLGVLLIAACSRPPTPELARDELFTLSIGPLDEQINLFRLAGAPVRGTTSISMRDGLFYIANGNAGKIMQLSSHGDLVLLIYDPDTNPEPVGFALPASSGEGEIAATRIAVPHPFNDLGDVAVDRTGRIAVVDAVAAAGDAAGAANGAAGGTADGAAAPGTPRAHGQVVRRFSPRGEDLSFIGQEGVGGTPFPLVHRLTVTAGDGLVVIARTVQQWLVFWYDADGRLLERVELPHTRLVGGEDAVVIRDVFPHLAERRLTLLVDRWRPRAGARPESDAGGAGEVGAAADPRSGPEIGVGGPEIRLYDIASRSVVAEFPLPAGAAGQAGSTGQGDAAAVGLAAAAGSSYYPLGVTEGGRLFLTRREDERTHSLLVLSRGGGVVTRRLFKLEEAGLSFVTLGMSADGVMFGLLAEAEIARVVWWRGDLLLAQTGAGATGGM